MATDMVHRPAAPMTIEEIELACDGFVELDFSRHALEAAALELSKRFYPLGFPVELRTNSVEILRQAGEAWSVFTERFDTKPIQVDVHVVEDGCGTGVLGEVGDCPPTPSFRMMQPLLVSQADENNWSIANLDEARTQIVVSQATLQYPAYLKYFFLSSAPMCHIATQFATPVHAGCVSLHRRGVMLCGDSGAGKSSLSYACARAGWTYTSDDACFLLNAGDQRLVTANCHQVRLRPSAATLFPEIEGLEITPRAAGKPSIEMPTASMPGIDCAPTANVDFLVFLNRRTSGPPELRPYRQDVARYFLRQAMFGSAQSLAVQYVAAERLLTAAIFELRYSSLDWAIDRLATLVQEGR